MEQADPVDASRGVVADRFPDAAAAFLGRSVLTQRRTATSDLDVVVVVDGPPAPYRETLRSGGWVVELFVHTPASLLHYWARDAELRRPALLRMCADAHVLVSRGAAADRYARDAQARLLAGPEPPPTALVDRQRYATTDLLDDLRGATDPVEAAYVASALVQSASELVLLVENRWSGTGKWLARQLGEADDELPGRLVAGQRLAANGDTSLLDAVAVQVLDRAGGPLSDGYRVRGETSA